MSVNVDYLLEFAKKNTLEENVTLLCKNDIVKNHFLNELFPSIALKENLENY